MDDELHKKLVSRVEELRTLVAMLRTHDVVNTFTVLLRKWDKSGKPENKLTSPGKQISYLFGVLMDTVEFEEPIHLDGDTTNELVRLLNAIFECYAMMYWPQREQIEKESSEWYQHCEVAMPAFLHFFCNPVLASVEQVRNRISIDFEPFDDVIKNELGLDLKSLLLNAKKIGEYQQNAFDQMVAKTTRLKQVQKQVMESIPRDEFNRERLSQAIEKLGVKKDFEGYLNNIDNFFSINTESIELIEKDKFLEQFSLKRVGNILPHGKLIYITEYNPVEERPLIYSSDDIFICYSINALYLALYQVLSKIVIGSDCKEPFFKRRDRLLESQSQENFMSFLSEEAVSYTSLFEQKSLHKEHDLIIASGKNLYIIEAKASPPIEPFRDAEKAFTRIERHFTSDRGIQKGFVQGNNLRRRIIAEGKIELFGKDKNVALTLNENDYDNIFCLVVTRDDFGPVASNLDLLLQKEKDDPFPWVVSILELETLLSAYIHLNMGEEKLIQYINERIKLHGIAFGGEELEFAGYYIRHGSFEHIFSNSQDRTFLDSSYSDIFDEIYMAEQMGERVSIKATPPFFSDSLLGTIKQTPSPAKLESVAPNKAGRKDVKTKEATKKKVKRKAQKQSRKKNRKKKK